MCYWVTVSLRIMPQCEIIRNFQLSSDLLITATSIVLSNVQIVHVECGNLLLSVRDPKNAFLMCTHCHITATVMDVAVLLNFLYCFLHEQDASDRNIMESASVDNIFMNEMPEHFSISVIDGQTVLVFDKSPLMVTIIKTVNDVDATLKREIVNKLHGSVVHPAEFSDVHIEDVGHERSMCL